MGRGAVFLSGVTIGHGAVIATRAVVTKDVPPYAIVAGNPARVVRQRFSPDIQARLLKVRIDKKLLPDIFFFPYDM